MKIFIYKTEKGFFKRTFVNGESKEAGPFKTYKEASEASESKAKAKK